MSHLTTHILDATAGTPAAGVAVTLTDTRGDVVATGVTDADGRLGLGPDELAPGDYALRFATGPYFAAAGVASFYPYVTVAFTVYSGYIYIQRAAQLLRPAKS